MLIILIVVFLLPIATVATLWWLIFVRRRSIEARTALRDKFYVRYVVLLTLLVYTSVLTVWINLVDTLSTVAHPGEEPEFAGLAWLVSAVLLLPFTIYAFVDLLSAMKTNTQLTGSPRWKQVGWTGIWISIVLTIISIISVVVIFGA